MKTFGRKVPGEVGTRQRQVPHQVWISTSPGRQSHDTRVFRLSDDAVESVGHPIYIRAKASLGLRRKGSHPFQTHRLEFPGVSQPPCCG